MLAYALMSVFPAAMIYAALSDVQSLTIPNKISIALVVAFVALFPFSDLTLQQFGTHLGVGAAMLLVGMALFAGGLVGGGDAKLIAAASLWLGYDMLMPFLGYTALIGGVLAFGILIYRRAVVAETIAKCPQWMLRLHDKKTGIPYGVAIAGAAIGVFPGTQVFVNIAM